MRMCKCTTKIVWEWEEQCFAAEYVWEFMSFCENCWERFYESCWERFCESYWGSGIQVAEGVRVVEVLFTCWRCESFLLLLFFEYVPKQSTRVIGLRDLFIGNLIFTDTSQNRQNMGTWPISQTWPNRHDHCQTCKPLKIESLRLSFTFSKPSLTDSSLKPSWRPRGIYVELEFLRLKFHVDAAWNFATWEHANRALEARFTAWISSLKGSIC